MAMAEGTQEAADLLYLLLRLLVGLGMVSRGQADGHSSPKAGDELGASVGDDFLGNAKVMESVVKHVMMTPGIYNRGRDSGPAVFAIPSPGPASIGVRIRCNPPPNQRRVPA